MSHHSLAYYFIFPEEKLIKLPKKKVLGDGVRLGLRARTAR